MPKIKRAAPSKKAFTSMQASEATTAESNFGELAPTPRMIQPPTSPRLGAPQKTMRMVMPQSSKAKQAKMMKARRRSRPGTVVLKEIRKY